MIFTAHYYFLFIIIGGGGLQAAPRDENFLRGGGGRLGRLSSVCVYVRPGGAEKRVSEVLKHGQENRSAAICRSHVFRDAQNVSVARSLSVHRRSQKTCERQIDLLLRFPLFWCI